MIRTIARRAFYGARALSLSDRTAWLASVIPGIRMDLCKGVTLLGLCPRGREPLVRRMASSRMWAKTMTRVE